MNKEYALGLYEHNVEPYIKSKEALEKDDIAAIVHATGTGKSYVGLQLAYDYKGKKTLYVVPSNGIIEHLEKVIENNPNLDKKRDFPNLEFRTYQSFINMSREEIAALDVEFLILDEFHHIGAPVWGARVNTLVETHPDMKIFGMTAYTVRDRGTAYERDMANPETNELFSNRVVSRYDLCDAMIDGVLPKPIYKSAYVNLAETATQLEKRIQKLDARSSEYQQSMKLLKDAKRRIQEAPSIANIMKKNLKTNGKYIYFCPPISEDGVNNMETIVQEVKTWCQEMGLREDDYVLYQTTSQMREDGKKNREAFYHDMTLGGEDASKKLKIMFAINQYNEGIHAPNVDGVIMGRGTTSDIVFFEQLGRGLAVRGNTREKLEEYEQYSLSELFELCKERDILVKENSTKEELIEKLLAPIIIDLTNNYDFIKELENRLKDRIRERRESGLGEKRNIKISDPSFDIEIENQELFEMLQYLSDRLTNSWNKMYEYAKLYYEKHGDLEVPQRFKTMNGYDYDENGTINLGYWIGKQRSKESPESERGKLLAQIGMRFEPIINNMSWEEWYEYARKYYKKHGDLEVPKKFKTNNGYDYDEDGIIRLGNWISAQRQKENPESKRGKLLLQIGMRFESKKMSWEEWYEYARKYYKKHGDLEVPARFKTTNGYDYDENGTIKLGQWINGQRRKVSPNKERVKLLLQIGMRFESKNMSWEEWYHYAKLYYEKHGNLEVPHSFKTNNGYDYDENGTINLGIWISTQRQKESPESERGKLLLQIGMRFENKNMSWEEWYHYAKLYYEHHGDLEVPTRFKTTNGYDYDENGTINLGIWISTQRQKETPESERGKLLTQIGMRFEKERKHRSWEEWYKYANLYYEKHGNLEISHSFKTNNGYDYDENGTIKLGKWIDSQRQKVSLESERGRLLTQIGMIWHVKKNKIDIEELCMNHEIDMKVNKVILSHISIQELQSKISFLNELNIPIVDEKGILHEIFSMSNNNMKEKYQVRLEELVSKYYLSSSKKRG